MHRAILADLHLGQRDTSIADFSQSLSAIRAGGAKQLILLGDVFRALVGYPHFWDETIKEGLALLGDLRKSGVRIVLVEGNRDFFIDTPALGPFFDSIGVAHSFEAGGLRFLVEHGDLINQHDRAYLFWRAISKSPAARVWARLLPGVLARCIMLGTEAKLAKTNFSYRVDLPQEALQTAAKRHFATGVHVVLWGHFHRSWSWGEGIHQAYIVPAWAQTRSIMWVDDDGSLRIDQPDRQHFIDTTSESWYHDRESTREAR
jgi:UDP-2,3-diacylglucosamine pyrophosphatase LpxH